MTLLQMRRETAAFVVLTLSSACTSVTKVTVTPSELQALAGMQPEEERVFHELEEDERMVARGNDDVRLLIIPSGRGGERIPAVQQEPWGKLYTLRWGSSVTLTPTDRGANMASLSFPSTEVWGAQLQMSRYSGTRTTVLVLCIVGAVVTIGLGVLIAGAAHAGGG
jgi:hypothetical protein